MAVMKEVLRASGLEIVNLLETHQQELVEFERKVQKANGKVQVLVHPYFNEEDPEFSFPPKLPGYKLRRDKFVQACLTHDIPIIIFEEESHYPLLPGRIGNLNATLYTVPTIDKEITPVGDTRAWDRLLGILRRAKVTKISVGGQYLFFYDKDTIIVSEKGIINSEAKLALTAGCVGVLARSFRGQNFQVSLSPISSPRLNL